MLIDLLRLAVLVLLGCAILSVLVLSSMCYPLRLDVVQGFLSCPLGIVQDVLSSPPLCCLGVPILSAWYFLGCAILSALVLSRVSYPVRLGIVQGVLSCTPWYCLVCAILSFLVLSRMCYPVRLGIVQYVLSCLPWYCLGCPILSALVLPRMSYPVRFVIVWDVLSCPLGIVQDVLSCPLGIVQDVLSYPP